MYGNKYRFLYFWNSHSTCLSAFNMALNVPGLIMMILFYILILGIGLFAAWKSKKVEKNGNGDRQEALLLGNRNINSIVGIFTMTGILP